MGKIQNEVTGRHLVRYSSERELLLAFLTCFDVTWANRIKKNRTEFSAYFLSPEQTVKDQFGIDHEVLLIISDFKEIQPRTMQAIDEFMRESPAVGRIDPTTVFLIAPDPKVREWVESYAALNPQFRVTVALSKSQVHAERSDPWFIRRALSEQLFSRDLFNDQLPLRSDTFFFGRTKLSAELVTSIKLGQNRGVFGLRKTGKTSLLFKVRRMAKEEGIRTLYYDCKDPSIRSLRWDLFLEEIMIDIEREYKKKAPAEGHVSKRFKSLIADVCSNGRMALIFDEIEWISPVAKIDDHWHEDFVPFWQTMWSTQSEVRELAFLVAGVNPTVTELAEVNDVQNPLFGIISPTYLTGFAEADIRQMLGKFGKRMGLRFDHSAAKYMYDRYGGHPLLTRMAASLVNTKARDEGVIRPVHITDPILRQSEEERDGEVMYYCPHVVTELRKFYPDEYQMLEWLATGNDADFYEFAERGSNVKHLMNYGVIFGQPGDGYTIAIRVLERFIVDQMDGGRGEVGEIYTVPMSQRSNWLRNRVERIGTDIRRLDKLGKKDAKPILYGTNGFPEAENFFAIRIVDDLASLESFLNVANKCFVESVERLGRELGKTDYFWREVKDAYPDLWRALVRAKIYRHDAMHLELTQRSAAELAAMHARDFGGRDFRGIPDGYFLVQQKVLDGLFLAVMVETDRLL